MGIFDKARDEAQNLTQENPDQVSQGMDQAEQMADQATGGRFGGQIRSGTQAARRQMGMQPDDQDSAPGQDSTWGQDPSQDQGRDPSQDQGWGQDESQDPNQYQ